MLKHTTVPNLEWFISQIFSLIYWILFCFLEGYMTQICKLSLKLVLICISFCLLIWNERCVKCYFCVCVIKALQHGFLNFETFDVTEYEHYEVIGKCFVLALIISYLLPFSQSVRPFFLLVQHVKFRIIPFITIWILLMSVAFVVSA